MASKGEFSQFLRARRDQLQPVDVGLPARGDRRVPGLRREEVASLAGVSLDYYVRLEQGRDISASPSVLDAIAGALRLDRTERLYLHTLAGPSRPREPVIEAPRVRPAVQRLIDGFDTPAFVVGHRTDLIASNRHARALLGAYHASETARRNHARWLFLVEDARNFYVDWATVAKETVATLRLAAGRHPDDPELSSLIGELTIKSPDFSRWWTEHHVLDCGYGDMRLHHPAVGPVTVTYETLRLPDDEQTLFVYSAEAGSSSATALALLDALEATPAT